MDGPKWLDRLRPRFLRLGVDKLECGTDDARRYCMRKNAEAASLIAFGVVYFRDESPSTSAVLEEYAHAVQDRAGRYVDSDVRIMSLRREIEVHECLESLAVQLGLSDLERELNRQRLQDDRADLEKRLERLQ
jgi:hypothetical protein